MPGPFRLLERVTVHVPLPQAPEPPFEVALIELEEGLVAQVLLSAANGQDDRDGGWVAVCDREEASAAYPPFTLITMEHLA